MKTLMFPVLFLLGGCIIYDHDGKCRECELDTAGLSENGGNGGNNGGNNGGDDTATDDSGTDSAGDDTAPPETTFTLSPNTATAGDVVIASLTATNFDISTVASTEFFGDVEVLASENRGTEILFTISIPATAPSQSADLVLILNDGSVELLDDVLAITAADGSGSTGSDPSNGGGDTGTGCE